MKSEYKISIVSSEIAHSVFQNVYMFKITLHDPNVLPHYHDYENYGICGRAHI